MLTCKNYFPMKRIVDEFSDKPISRQRKYQLRMIRGGRCPCCGQIKPKSDSGPDVVLRTPSVREKPPSKPRPVPIQKAPKKKIANTQAYRSWKGMKRRCFDTKHTPYKYYGGRGITVCERWMDFNNFLEDMGEPPEGKTLGRIDNDLGYFKENCEWQTTDQQSNNKCTTIFVEYMGKRITLSQASKASGILYATLRQRLNRGLLGDALFSKNSFAHDKQIKLQSKP